MGTKINDNIHQLATDCRRQILLTVEKRTIGITEDLEKVKQQLCTARDEEEFFETDLEEWKKKLDTIKKKLAEPLSIDLEHEVKDNFVVSNIILNVATLTDFFERPTGDIRVEDGGKLVVHGTTITQAAVRGRDEYSCGRHRFQFKIEHLGNIKWIFFGIISRNAPVEAHSYKTPANYGWAGKNQVYINGIDNSGFNNYNTDMEMYDTMELLVDCDSQIIHLTNQRTKRTHSLIVDVIQCPFPWQLNLNLYNANDRVRILSM